MTSQLGIGNGGLCPRALVACATLAAVAWGAPRCALAQPGGVAEADFSGQHVIPLQFRSAREVLPQVRTLTSGARAQVFAAPDGNQLVVRGPDAAVELARQIIERLDQPGAAPTLHSYSVPAKHQAAVIRWSQEFRGEEGESVAWDGRTGQLIVVANPQVHGHVRAMLGDARPMGARAPQPTALTLNNLSPQQLHERLQRLAGRPLPATWDGARRWFSFPVRLGDGVGVDVLVDANRGDVKLRGPDQQVRAWTEVFDALDASPAQRGRTEVIATPGARSPAVRQALAVIEESSGKRPSGARLASAMQPDAQTQPVQPQAPDQPATIPGTREQAELLQDVADAQAGSLLGPVDVQFIEGLDIIVIRGNQQDVERVLEIIREIEQKSIETAPSIVVHELQFVDSVTMAGLLNRVYQQALSQRTGGISIIPLAVPNALLLIGREETVNFAIRQLIEPLDRDFESSALFRVFPLEHASAVDAKALVDEFLAEPAAEEGAAAADEEAQLELAPRAIVVADYRTNSLFVRASARTLLEIDKLLQGVDTGVAPSMDEVRVFNLRNARAQEMADLLTAAITEGAGAATPAEEGARSRGLQLMTIDAQTQQMLRSGVLTNVRIEPDIRNNSLVVTAPPQSMNLIAALIETLDRAPTAEAEIKVFTIENGDAFALAEMLRSLFGAGLEDDPETGGLSAAADTLVRLQFSVDERTNSIIAAGSVADLAVVEAILLRLDGSEARDRRTEVYRLKNAPALETADAINLMIQQQRDIEEAAELAIGPFAQLEREIIVVPETVSNSLIISAAPEAFDKILQLVKDIDERPPMVMIQVLIAEVTLNDTDEFGVELGLQDPLLFDRSVVGELTTITTTTNTQSPGGATVSTETQEIVNAPLSPGFNFNDVQNPLGNNGSDNALLNAQNVASQALSNFGVGRFNSELGFGGFVFSAGSSSVNMLLRALQENRRLEVLSRPQIMALDNQVGTIRVGARVPTIQGVSQLATGAQQNQIQYQDVGIILTVQPRISPDDQVVMYVGAEKSQLGPESEGVPVFAAPGGTVVRAPVINQTVAETTVAAASGQTVVLSGLLTKETSEIHRRVPLIAEIPLIGDLFRYDSVSEARTELLIIMTPRVIRSELDSDMLKQIESSRMSWVMCDVVTMNGPAGLRSRCDEWGPNEAPEVYPNYVPQNELLPPAQGMEGPVQPELWDGGARTEPATGSASANVTPAGYAPPAELDEAGASAPASGLRRLPPTK